MSKAVVINYNKLIDTAEHIVRSMTKKHHSVIAAYSSGSFARRDMVYGSDIDIAFIASGYPASNKLPPEVTRIIVEDIVFEWAFVEKEAYDVKALLENSPSICDLAVANIWFDPENFFGNIQKALKKEYTRPELIKLRALNQLKIVENNFNELKKSVINDQFDNLLTHLFLIVMHAFNIPSVILNRPVTHCRSYLYCRSNSNELGFDNYADLVNKILCTDSLGVDKVYNTLNNVIDIFESCGFPREDVDTYKAQLKTVEYLLDIKEPRAAIWPLYFWVVGAWHEAKRDNLTNISEKIYESFKPIRKELRLNNKSDIEARIKIIEGVISKSKKMINNHHFVNHTNKHVIQP